MKTLKYENYVEYDEIFRWAEKKEMAHWNTCCDIFHRTEIFRNREIHQFYKDEIESYLEELRIAEPTKYNTQEHIDNCTKAYEILLAFMKEHEVDFMNVLGGSK